MVKAPRVVTAPLSLHVYKRAKNWFIKWYTRHISLLATPPTDTQQYHSVLTGVLSNVAVWIQNTEALHPVISAQSRVDQETKG